MTREEEYAFLTTFASAMSRSDDRSALERLWRDYGAQIAALSPEGRAELQRARGPREKELTNERTKQ